MPTEWDAYLERMGTEEAHAPNIRRAPIPSERANSCHFRH